MRNTVYLHELRNLSITFPGDVYSLAAWIVASDRARSIQEQAKAQYNSIVRVMTSINGLIGYIASMTDTHSDDIAKHFIDAGIPLGATLETDGNDPEVPVVTSVKTALLHEDGIGMRKARVWKPSRKKTE